MRSDHFRYTFTVTGSRSSASPSNVSKPARWTALSQAVEKKKSHQVSTEETRKDDQENNKTPNIKL